MHLIYPYTFTYYNKSLLSPMGLNMLSAKPCWRDKWIFRTDVFVRRTWLGSNNSWVESLKKSCCFDIILYRMKLVWKCLVPVKTEGVWIYYVLMALRVQVLTSPFHFCSCVAFYMSIFIYNLQVSNTTGKINFENQSLILVYPI